MKLTINGEEVPLNEEDESCGNKLMILGCGLCLCTACLSWVPMCVWCCNMKSKYGDESGEARANNNEEVPHQRDDFQQSNQNHNNQQNNDPVYGVPMATSNNNNNDDAHKKNCGEARCAAGPVCTPPRSPARSNASSASS